MRVTKSNKSIRSKLVSALRYVILAGLVAGFGFTSLTEYNEVERRLRDDISVLANIIGNRSIAALVFNDKDAAHTNLSAARFHPSIDLICLYDKSGSLFSEYIIHSTERRCQVRYDNALDVQLSEFNSDMTGFALTLDVSDQGDVIGYIKISGNNKSMHYSFLKFGSILLLVFVSLWFAMSYVAKHSVRRILKPLEELYSTAIAITDKKQYQIRARKLSEDEIGDMVDVFNNMLDSLAEENRALFSSEQRFRTLTSNAPIGIFQRDSHVSITYANEKWYEILGLKVGVEDQQGNNILKKHQREYVNTWKALQKKPEKQTIEYSYQNPASQKVLSLMEYVSPLYNSQGESKGFIGTLVDVTELKNAQLELEKLAFYDPLTGLPNRRFFRDHLNIILEDLKRSNICHAIFMLDLDNFKKVNDTLGHDSGDLLLKNISNRLRSSVPESCVFSRMGGDEFLFLLPNTNADGAASVAQKILDTISDPIEISGHQLEINGSIGISLSPEDGVSSHDLLKNADMALYGAKDSGRNQINFYSQELDSKIKENMRLESKLVQAVNNEILDIYLQPYFASATNGIAWAEALLRWQDKHDGMIPPDRFIPLAEGLGVIHKLGRWVIEQVCYHLTKHAQYLQEVNISGIAINLSALQFYSRNFLAEVSSIFRNSGIDPEKVEFELTESMVMGDTESAIRIMSALRDLGCRISIDDFGTGYSSLSYLKRFPITALKIDRSFVADLPHDKNDLEICTAIIAMAHKLGLSVIAEGVETNVQRDFLLEQGCEYLQGFLFARPEEVNLIVQQGRSKLLRVVK